MDGRLYVNNSKREIERDREEVIHTHALSRLGLLEAYKLGGNTQVVS
jgi:hypothetical protein